LQEVQIYEKDPTTAIEMSSRSVVEVMKIFTYTLNALGFNLLILKNIRDDYILVTTYLIKNMEEL
jgi:hypothetical protein